MSVIRLEMIYQANVVLYIDRETTLRNYRLVNKRAHEAIRCLKVNPRSIYLGYNFLFNFFPRLNTLTGNLNTMVRSLTQKQINQITWFDCACAVIFPETFDNTILSKIITISIPKESICYVQTHCPKVRKIVVTLDDDYSFENLKFRMLQKLVIKKSINEKLKIKLINFVTTNPDVSIGIFNIQSDEIDIDINLNEKYHSICIKDITKDVVNKIVTPNTLQHVNKETPFFEKPKMFVKNFNEKFLNFDQLLKSSYLGDDCKSYVFTLNISFGQNNIQNMDLTKLNRLNTISMHFDKTVETTVTMPTQNIFQNLSIFNFVSKSPNTIHFIGIERCPELKEVKYHCSFTPIHSIYKNVISSWC
ncbi:hypothetical protein EIN_339610 [Entamoeba invadens IP1]|uniref:Uncharacterized protein n=1 Tax=Entamoeba invadens IP1 TaxID=370355 RepID=A0A0A1UAN6_ENTIV|nr:hypothetical protein EIN_339610 [Entamoeba invadens IP1]ELP90260.1 hypothetical protein EIN_339610 [Entamoeba invadens IP1]|eukprot:XP_004257031.1 hypothetical protein EIN_339610 [Entamoeba invadens IP1]